MLFKTCHFAPVIHQTAHAVFAHAFKIITHDHLAVRSKQCQIRRACQLQRIMPKQRFRRTVDRQNQAVAIQHDDTIGCRIEYGLKLRQTLLLGLVPHHDLFADDHRFGLHDLRFNCSLCQIGWHKDHHRCRQIAPWQGLEHDTHRHGSAQTRPDLQQG